MAKLCGSSPKKYQRDLVALEDENIRLKKELQEQRDAVAARDMQLQEKDSLIAKLESSVSFLKKNGGDVSDKETLKKVAKVLKDTDDQLKAKDQELSRVLKELDSLKAEFGAGSKKATPLSDFLSAVNDPHSFERYESAAGVIQQAWKTQRQKEREILSKAALKIQANFRGHQIRKRLALVASGMGMDEVALRCGDIKLEQYLTWEMQELQWDLGNLEDDLGDLLLDVSEIQPCGTQCAHLREALRQVELESKKLVDKMVSGSSVDDYALQAKEKEGKQAAFLSALEKVEEVDHVLFGTEGYLDKRAQRRVSGLLDYEEVFLTSIRQVVDKVSVLMDKAEEKGQQRSIVEATGAPNLSPPSDVSDVRRRKLFNELCLRVKINLSQRGTVANLRADELYDSIVKNQVPFDAWEQFITSKLTAECTV